MHFEEVGLNMLRKRRRERERAERDARVLLLFQAYEL